MLMSIATLGAQGAKFDDRIFDRIATLHALRPNLVVSVDGGVSESNIERLARAGATRFCVGSAISKSPNPSATYARLMELAKSAAPLR
jgi:pentose-5-phosphate-3-epimerase